MKRMLFVFTVLAYGCGGDNPGSPANTPDASDSDAQPDAGNGNPSTMYPAFPIDTGVIINNGGQVLANPEIVTITWTTDPDVATYELFADTIGASNYWRLINSEYGIGPAVSTAADHVHISTAPPTSMTDSQIQQFIITNMNSAGWPAPNTSMLYAVYLSPTTTTPMGCVNGGFLGYHGSFSTGGHTYAYAVNAHCGGAAQQTSTAAHEFDEAATDPFRQRAWAGFDDAHIAWELLLSGGDELGDVCWDPGVGFYPFDDHEAGFMFSVQRQWSNRSAMAGHAPCVPALPTPYYGVTILPNQVEPIAVNLRALYISTSSTKGFKVPMGQSRTFSVGYFSDRATSGPWTLTTNVPATLSGTTVANGTAMITIDKPSGVNGEQANITVTPQTFAAGGFVYVEIVSHLPGYETHTTPFLIGSN